MTSHGAEQEFDRIAVVGFGMVGASFAAAVRANHPETHILAVDVDEPTLRTAVEQGWADEAAHETDETFMRFVSAGCDLVVLAVPIEAAGAYFSALSQWGYRGIITDTTSTKGHISQLAQELLAYPENFVPGHPMAGSERNGIEGARADLFKGAHWILCPDAHTPAEHYPRLHEFIASLGARVIVLPREQHDEAVAIVSHVPHVVASALMQLASRHADDQQALMRLAAGGFKDSTRIAAGSSELWCGISFDNKDALLGGLKEYREIIQKFECALSADDRETFTQLLEDAASARRALPAAWVPSTSKLLEVRIPMEDRTGVVAEVTTIASKVGCNIQSIDIDHVTEDSAVLNLILTDEGDVGQLSIQLIAAGYSVSFSPLTAKEHCHAN